MNKNKLILILAAVTILCIGCPSEPVGEPANPAVKGYLPETITNYYEEGEYGTSGAYIYKYEYDNLNRFKSIKEFYKFAEDDAELVYESTFTYSSSGRLTGVTCIDHSYGDTDQVSFRYEGNSVFLWDDKFSWDDELELVLNDKQQIIKIIVHFWGEEYYALYYYDKQGNCIKVEAYDSGEIGDITKVEYDHMKGINSSINMPPWFMFIDFRESGFSLHQSNNILRITDDYNYYYETFSYIYNDNGYPEKASCNYNGIVLTSFTKNKTQRINGRKKSIAIDESNYYIIEYIPVK
ncbi:MAG: hypothetical protein LBH92_09145 [Bacteroidales bacterium]|jgi:hypothetical protein|nr:hypothetical protein [Bacteroidales bacterium]